MGVNAGDGGDGRGREGGWAGGGARIFQWPYVKQ